MANVRCRVGDRQARHVPGRSPRPVPAKQTLRPAGRAPAPRLLLLPVCAGPAWGSPAALLARAELPGGRGRLRQAPQRTHGCRRLGSAHRGRSRLRTGNVSAHPCAPARRPLCDTCPRPMRPTALGVWHLLCGAQCREQTARPVRRCARLHTLAARPVGGPGSACSRKRHPPPAPHALAAQCRLLRPSAGPALVPAPRPLRGHRGRPPSERNGPAVSPQRAAGRLSPGRRMLGGGERRERRLSEIRAPRPSGTEKEP